MDLPRRFIPGDEWLYYRIYAGTGIQDKLLLNVIYMAAGQLYSDQLIDKFFFVRYTDQDGPHLRLRFHLTGIDRLAAAMLAVNRSLKGYTESRIISKVVVDTYQREIERYTAEHIEDVETVFSVNSWAVLNIGRQYFGQEDQLWMASIKLADDLLEDLGFDLDKKITIFRMLHHSSWKDQPVNHLTNAALSMKYRTCGPKIRARFDLPLEYNAYPVSPFVSREYQQKALAGIRAGNAPSMDNIVGSIIHMLFNRCFPVNQNAIEMVVYYMMPKFYLSRSIQALNSVR
jgi:thiopeptide-type bacteriocin biosynthesis protein